MTLSPFKNDCFLITTGNLAGVNLTFSVSSLVGVPKAEEQVHEEVAQRRGGIERAGGGGGLPGRAVRGLRAPAEGRDAGSLNRSSSSHKVTEILKTRGCNKKKYSLNMSFSDLSR